MKNTSKKKSKEHKNKKKKKTNNNNMKHEKIYKLLRFEELPEYMKENEFILDHYRAEWPIKQAVGSIFSWHNETVNVWTWVFHIFIFICCCLLVDNMENNSSDTILIIVFMIEFRHLLGFFLFLALTLVHLRDVPQVANLLDHFSWWVPLDLCFFFLMKYVMYLCFGRGFEKV